MAGPEQLPAEAFSDTARARILDQGADERIRV
jgi:hypothetical protein